MFLTVLPCYPFTMKILEAATRRYSIKSVFLLRVDQKCFLLSFASIFGTAFMICFDYYDIFRNFKIL